MGQRITVRTSKGSLGSGRVIVVANTTGFVSTTVNADADHAANTVGETVSAMYVSALEWSGAANGVLTILRGANTVWECYGNGEADFSEKQMRLETGGDAQY